MDPRHQPKPCALCGSPFAPKHQYHPDAGIRARYRYRFAKVRFCSPTCQGLAQRTDPTRQAKTRGGAAGTAKRLKPFRPCERCGETRRSQIHHRDRNHMNNELSNLERLCHWCHGKEHAPEIKARHAHHWQVRRERYGPGGHR